MKRLKVIALFAFTVSALAQTPAIHSGATVYIEPMGGYETYLAAAFAKKHIPLIVVTDKTKAEFIVTSNMNQNRASAPAVVVNNSNTASAGDHNTFNNASTSGFPGPNDAKMRSFGETDASISIVDVKSSQIVFATSTYQRGAADQKTKTAERCATRLNDFIKKSEKPKK